MGIQFNASYVANQAKVLSLSNEDNIALLNSNKVNRSEIGSTLSFYVDNISSGVGSYTKLVTSNVGITEASIGTGSITGSNQNVGSFITEQSIFEEGANTGVSTLELTGAIQKVSGDNAIFYYTLSKYAADTTVTLLATSNTTAEVKSFSFEQFTQKAQLTDVTWLETDRVLIQFYGSKVGTGSDPVYNFRVGGQKPIKFNFNVPSSSINIPFTLVKSKLLENVDVNIVSDLEKVEVTKLVSDVTAARTNLAVESSTELNVRDVQSKARANHTGTQELSTISDAGSLAASQLLILQILLKVKLLKVS